MIKSSLAFSLLTLAAIHIGLGLLLRSMFPDLAPTTFMTGLIGGAFCAFWGVLGLCGHRVRGWTILTLAVVSFILLSQAVSTWMGSSAPALAATLMSIMLLASIAVLMAIAYSGQIAAQVRGEPTRPQGAAQRARNS